MAGAFVGVGGPGWVTLALPLHHLGCDLDHDLIPIQIMQSRLARRFADDGVIAERYWRLATLWYVLGGIAIALPLVNIYLMSPKP